MRWYLKVLLTGTVLWLALVVMVHSPAGKADAQTMRSGPLSVYSQTDLDLRDLTYRDTRFLYMRDTDTPFSLPDYTSRARWEQRAAELREQILVSTGLWPLPDKTPLNAHISGRIVHDDYTVEKVYIETYPGFYLAGNLYRPRGKQGPFPGIVSPHGHWDRGRLVNTEINSVPGRCINFAKRGFVVFAYDMIGYNDTRQIGHDFAADSLSGVWGIDLMGIQLWNSIRAVDFITELPDVDSTRIGVTGASGGGTQTFLLTAVDPRIKVTAPVNMLSAHFQGGCLCENAPGLRLNDFNIEIGALAAPRPLLMVSNTHDWTANTPRVEYPMMQKMYGLYDAKDHVKYVQFDYPHNYNQVSREAVYAWFARWLQGAPARDRLPELPFQVEKDQDLLVFLKHTVDDRDLTYDDLPDSLYSLPAKHINGQELKNYLKGQARGTLDAAWPKKGADWSLFERVFGSAYRHVLAAKIPEAVSVEVKDVTRESGYQLTKLLISRAGKKDWIPALLYEPDQPAETVTLVVSSRGKASTARGSDGVVQSLLAKGDAVLTFDVFGIAEHRPLPGTETARNTGFTHFTTFNRTDTQERVRDILTATAYARKNLHKTTVNLLGMEQGGIWALLAAGADPEYHSVVADGMRGSYQDGSWLVGYYIPGLARYGGLTTAAALAAGTDVTVYNGGSGLDTGAIRQAFRAAGKGGEFRFQKEAPGSPADLAGRF